MANMRKDKKLTGSATRQKRVEGKVSGSQPSPRPTQVSTMKQQGPLKPGTRTESNRSTSPRLPKLSKNPVRKPSNSAPAATTRRPAAQAVKATPMAAVKVAGRMGGPVAGTMMAAATPAVRKLGTAMGTKLGVALRPVGRAIDRTFGTKPKKKK
jgi:hypothetical protein